MSNKLRLEQIEQLPRKSLEGVFFRVVHKKHAKMPLDPRGSKQTGGRYNPPGEFGACYLGESEKVCWSELKRRNLLLNPEDYIMYKVKIKLNSVLDLTSTEVRRKLHLQRADDLLSEDYTKTQILGKAARKFGFEGILTPSATSAGAVLVVFSNMLSKNSLIRLRI